MLDTRAVVKLVRILQTPLGTGYEVQLVVECPRTAAAADTREPIGVDVGRPDQLLAE